MLVELAGGLKRSAGIAEAKDKSVGLCKVERGRHLTDTAWCYATSWKCTLGSQLPSKSHRGFKILNRVIQEAKSLGLRKGA